MLAKHAADLQHFNQQQLDALRENMAKHRDDAMRRYQQEMASFRPKRGAGLFFFRAGSRSRRGRGGDGAGHRGAAAATPDRPPTLFSQATSSSPTSPR